MYYNSTYDRTKRLYDYVQREPLISTLIAICVLTNTAAVVCFMWEVILHPNSFNWFPLILTLGMFVVPPITSRARHNQDSNTKNMYDIIFILYGAITLCVCCFSVGYAGDSPWGCSIEFWNNKMFACDMSHPGIWGAFFFAIASITGHAFGWEKIKNQRKKRSWIKTKNDWEASTGLYNINGSAYDKYVLDQKCAYKYTVKNSSYIHLITLISFLGLLILQAADGREPLAVLYFIGFIIQAFKGGYLVLVLIEDEEFDFTNDEKSLLASVINITVFVWLLGAEWHVFGKKIGREKDLSVNLLSTVFMTILAFLQHFTI